VIFGFCKEDKNPKGNIKLSPYKIYSGKKVSKTIYTCPCPGSGAKDMPSKEKVIT